MVRYFYVIAKYLKFYFLHILSHSTLIYKTAQIIHFWKGQTICFLNSELDFNFYKNAKKWDSF